METNLDTIDRQILGMLQNNARISNADIARELGMAPSGILERVKKLEQKEIIRGYKAQINPKAVGNRLLAFIFIRSQQGFGCSADTAAALKLIAEVQEVHHIAGEDCFLVKVRTEDSESLMELMRTKLSAIPHILSTKTTIVLETVKETIEMAIPND